MDESASKGMELNGSDANKRKTWRIMDAEEFNNSKRRFFHPEPQPQPRDDGMDLNDPRRIVTMIVSGYDKSLPEDDIKSLLSEHFSSCGEIKKVYIHAHAESQIHNKYAFVDIAGVGAKEQALQLNRSDVGRHKVLVRAKPAWTRFGGEFTIEKAVKWSELNERTRQIPRAAIVMVSGFDTRLPEESVKSALLQHFSSCGDIECVSIPKGKDGGLHKMAAVHIWGEDAVDKAQELSGSDMGGWQVDVGHCSDPRDRDISLHGIHM